MVVLIRMKLYIFLKKERELTVFINIISSYRDNIFLEIASGFYRISS